MKIITGIFFIISFSINAQSLLLGVAGGVTTSNTEDNISFDFDNYKGYYFCFFIEDTLINDFHYRIGVNINKNKAYKDYMKCQLGPVYYNDVEYLINFINMPFLIKYSFGRKVKFYLIGGPYLSLIAYSQRKAEVTSWSTIDNKMVTRNTKDSANNELNTFNIGLTTGGGFEFQFNNRIDFLLESRYKLYLFPIKSGEYEICNINNLNSIIISLGIKLKI
ncbi:MAG: PorT family protein [Bacteroidales bacterium]|nr:PorT family protein [Bacteroidales bacterium]